MPNNNDFRRLRSKRGVALVEVIVALAIITIVSFAAFSIIFSSVNFENKAIIDMRVAGLADDILDCYLYSADGNEFEVAIGKLVVFEKSEEKYIVSEDGYIIEVVRSESSLSFNATDKDGKVIFADIYERGK